MEKILYSDLTQIRVDKYLSKLPAVESRNSLNIIFENNSVKVNRNSVKKSYILSNGDIIEFELPKIEPLIPVAREMELEILFEDESICIVNKPAGLVVHPGAGNRDFTLLNGLIYHFGKQIKDVPRCGIVHRLDKETSGVIIISKDTKTHIILSDMFKKREIEKTYFSVVLGVTENQGVINKPIKRDKRNYKKMVISDIGKEAITKFKAIKHFNFFTLLLIKPTTGRTHQIRVHLNSLNHPIFADKIYGKNSIDYVPLNFSSKIKYLLSNKIKRHVLHAERICFSHPITKEILEIVAPLPKDFKFLIDYFEKNGL